MTLKIISPAEILFQGEVSAVTLPGQNGRFTVLNNHAAIISTLTEGDIAYEMQGVREVRHITGGIVDVNNNVVSVCVS